MDDGDCLVDRFEEHRSHLQAVAYRMLGSVSEAEDAVQETWLRVCGSRSDEVDNMRAWLTTITARLCLNMLRARAGRREETLDGRLPDPLLRLVTDSGPEDEALLADSVSLALLVVLNTLSPAERLAFVLHDLFSLPFDEIAVMIDRTPAATRQLASRARRRVDGADIPEPEPSLTRQRVVVDAFFAAARGGNLDDLVAVLDPDVVLRSDFGARRPGAPRVIRGVTAVAQQAFLGSIPNAQLHPTLVNGTAGVVVTVRGRPFAVMGFIVVGDRVKEIDAIADPDRVAAIAAAIGI